MKQTIKMHTVINLEKNRQEQYNEDYAKIRLVPYDLDIREIPIFREYCKKIGLNVTNTFRNDTTRTHGYQQYHDCFLTDDGTFLINKALEDIK